MRPHVSTGASNILGITRWLAAAALALSAVALGACGVINKDAPAELLLHAIECAYKQGHWCELFTQKNIVIERRHYSRHF